MSRRWKYDAVVVGSGFGGAITAEHLTAAGVRTALLERGPWRDTLPVRDRNVAHRAPLPQGRHFYTHILRNLSARTGEHARLPEWLCNANGFYDVFIDRHILIATTSGVGGGSHAYTALHHRPRNPHYWRDVSERTDEVDFEKHYTDFLQRMGSALPPSEQAIPNRPAQLWGEHPCLTVNENTWQPQMGMLFGDTVTPQNVVWGPKRIARQTTAYANEGLTGSFTGSKTTLDVAYLFGAMQKGLDILDNCEALTITANPAGAQSRFRLDYFHHRERRYATVECDHVFLGAGTLNTLKLLFRSQAEGALPTLQHLGQRFATNADSIGFWYLNDASRDFTQGLPCHGSVSFREGDGGAQFIQAGVAGLDRIPLPGALKRRLRGSLFFIGMGEDENNGSARWQKGRLRIQYSMHESAIYKEIHQRFAHLAAVSGRPLWFSRQWAATVHPLGGAPLHDDPAKGMLNGHGEAHAVPGLYVVDATALPRSPGTPPSMAIAAWSRHVACAFLQANGLAQPTHISPPTITRYPHKGAIA